MYNADFVRKPAHIIFSYAQQISAQSLHRLLINRYRTDSSRIFWCIFWLWDVISPEELIWNGYLYLKHAPTWIVNYYCKRRCNRPCSTGDMEGQRGASPDFVKNKSILSYILVINYGFLDEFEGKSYMTRLVSSLSATCDQFFKFLFLHPDKNLIYRLYFRKS